MTWRQEVLANIDALLDDDGINSPELRQDIWKLVCDSTADYVQRYRSEILNSNARSPLRTA